MHLLALALAVIACLLAAAPASAARLVTIDTPSRHVNPADVGGFNGDDHPGVLRANVLLPDGYDGRRRFPVVFLLHGVGDSYATMAKPSNGDIKNTARGLGAIIVMPEADRGFYSNWWNGGRRARPGWERFYLDELVPLVERRFRVRAGRRWHAVVGLSMGGFGAAYLAQQLPGYFGSSATFSGFVQHQRAQIGPGLRAVGGVEYEAIFGPMSGFYATGHNPTRLADNLRSTRVYVTVGDGVAQPGVAGSPNAIAGGGLVEAELRQQSEQYVAALRGAAVPVTYRPLGGVHDWPYWRRHLRDAIGWGLFKPVADAPRNWTYRTVASRGEMWGLRYAFASAPGEVVVFSRRGSRLLARGSGRVRIRNGAACGYTATLPFERAVPPAICGRIRVRVRPRRVRLGRRVRLRFRVRRVVGRESFPLAGARVRLGRKVVRTNRRGRARMRIRFRRRLGRRRVKVTKRGLRAVRTRIRVVR